jgi:transcriptional regulator with XRE-family HTH domain
MQMKTPNPQEPKYQEITVARLFSNAVNNSRLTQREIAQEAGYKRPNLITMFKTGETKIPIDKTPILAKILGLDPKYFLRVALREYHPEVLRAIEGTWPAGLLSDNECELILALRQMTNDGDPELETPEHRQALADLASALTSDARGA